MNSAIDLFRGEPDSSLYPTEAILQATKEVLENERLRDDALQYGPWVGYGPYRTSVAYFLSDFYAPRVGPVTSDRIFATNGATGGLAIILSRFANHQKTRRIWIVEPAYFRACQIFEDAGYGGCLRGVPEDEDGVDITYLRDQITKFDDGTFLEEDHGTHAMKSKVFKHIIYLVPTFSNPGGKTTTLQRRKELLELARQYDALIVADDVYDFLRWPAANSHSVATKLPPPVPRFVDLDRDVEHSNPWGNTISNGSFSKILAPGLRVGWVEASPRMVDGLQQAGIVRSGGSQGHFSSAIVTQMLNSGTLQTHIRTRLIPTYQERYNVLMYRIEEQLVGLGVRVSGYDHSVKLGETSQNSDEHTCDEPEPRVAGGFFLYLVLPQGIPPAEEISKQALSKYNVHIPHGMLGSIAGDPEGLVRGLRTFGHCVRICWAWQTGEQIEEGIRRLMDLLRELLCKTSTSI